MAVLVDLLVLLAFLQGCGSLRDGWRNARYARRYRRPGPPTGRALVLCPVKGADPELETNARSLMTQRYPDRRVVFLVDASNDPAVGVLESIEGAVVEVAGPAVARGQKVHNLLHGLDRFGSEADVWVFADADARFSPDWLGELMAPLGSPGVGATTGYRWYIPRPGSPASWVRSAWNATVAGFLGGHANNFAWGGSMAIRRETFRAARIARLWEGALSDDYALTRGVREHGLSVRYVPTCLVPSEGECTWAQLLEFTTRQIRITRVYAPGVWRLGMVSYTLFNVTFWWLTARVVAGGWAWTPAWLVIYGLTLARSGFRIQGVTEAIGDRLRASERWFYLLSPPLVALLYQVNFLGSLVSRRIVWKGISYRMASREETEVLGPPEN